MACPRFASRILTLGWATAFVSFQGKMRCSHPETEEPKTITLLRHVEVLNAERPAAPGAAAKPKPLLVTLAVPEDKVDFFSIIEGRGDLWLVPTPLKDTADGGGEAVANASTLAELLGIQAPQLRPALPAPPPFQTAIYRRGRVQINQFADGRLLASHAIDQGIRTPEKQSRDVPAYVPAPPPAEKDK